jgi:NADH-ubiquinone oxidoreductase chain 4
MFHVSHYCGKLSVRINFYFFGIQFNNFIAKFQFVETIQWLLYPNIHFSISIDGIFLFFVVLPTFLIPIFILVGWFSIKSYKREYMITF